MKIAIIGAGISGNLAARLLATRHQVTLLEADHYAGGHTNTVTVRGPEGPVAVDTGFMVFNGRTYPNFCRMLELLGVESQASDMSFSVHAEAAGLEYCGSSLNALFAQRTNLLSPRFYRLLRDILRFNRQGNEYAARAEADHLTLGEFLDNHGLGSEVRDLYLVPMLAAIWSAAPGEVESLPARFLLGFMRNHGLMQLKDRPQWRSITGGAKTYVERLLDPMADGVRLSSRVRSVERRSDGVLLHVADKTAEHFDGVVFTTHADQTLSMLTDATPMEREVLGAFPYQPNQAVLHSDASHMPSRKRAWASWNYRIPQGNARSASVTYDLNRLQGLRTSQPIFVTLNPTSPIDARLVHRTFEYHHPAYSLRSVDAQRRWREINGVRHTWFGGAYWGYGFHEDGVNSALSIASDFGITLDALQQPVVDIACQRPIPLVEV